MTGPVLPQLRVVALGGGTGLSTLLMGLKRYVATPGSPTGLDRRGGSRGRSSTKTCPDAPCLIRDLAAVVTVTDDGGSSGGVREEMQMLPPGDIRNCMVALSGDGHFLCRLFWEPVSSSAERNFGRLCAGGAHVVADSGDEGKDLSGDNSACDVDGADGR